MDPSLINKLCRVFRLIITSVPHVFVNSARPVSQVLVIELRTVLVVVNIVAVHPPVIVVHNLPLVME